MRFSDTTTLLSVSQSTRTVRGHSAPALTIEWHPDATRVGAMFHFGECRKLVLSRLSPDFAYFGPASRPLDDPYLSREPCLEFITLDRGMKITPLSRAIPIALDGKPLEAPASLSEAELATSPIITLGRRIALCLHLAAAPSTPKATLGLLGNSDAINAVRNSILSVADVHTPVLIRGETGTGKELTANAIVEAGARSGKPFLAVNIAALPRDLAAAEIFGHEKGAFTGATLGRKGLFEEADGGTLFLDEIGLANSEVQTALLRVLETGQVKGLGAKASTSVNVRILAATDCTTIDRAVANGGFSQALFHRLSAVSIDLPALRHHRQDIGLLFLHFLREILSKTGDLDKLDTAREAKRPWISAEAMTAIALAPWPGNVRQLRNFATGLAVANRGAELARLTPQLLATLSPEPPPAQTSAPDPAEPENQEISHAKLVDALARHGYDASRAARALRVSRSTIYDHIRRDPNLGSLSRISDEDFQRHVNECKGDLQLVAKQLRVSHRAVQLRVKKA